MAVVLGLVMDQGVATVIHAEMDITPANTERLIESFRAREFLSLRKSDQTRPGWDGRKYCTRAAL